MTRQNAKFPHIKTIQVAFLDYFFIITNIEAYNISLLKFLTSSMHKQAQLFKLLYTCTLIFE